MEPHGAANLFFWWTETFHLLCILYLIYKIISKYKGIIWKQEGKHFCHFSQTLIMGDSKKIIEAAKLAIREAWCLESCKIVGVGCCWHFPLVTEFNFLFQPPTYSLSNRTEKMTPSSIYLMSRTWISISSSPSEMLWPGWHTFLLGLLLFLYISRALDDCNCSDKCSNSQLRHREVTSISSAKIH